MSHTLRRVTGRLALPAALALLLSLAFGLSACGGDNGSTTAPPAAPTLTPVPVAPTDLAPPEFRRIYYFPVELAVLAGRAHVNLATVSRTEPDDDGLVTVTIDGIFRVLEPGEYDFTLTMFDDEGTGYPDAAAELHLPNQPEPTELAFKLVFEEVPLDVTLGDLDFDLAGGGSRPEFSWHLIVPVEDIPVTSQ